MESKTLTIGVLALQGGFARHVQKLTTLGVKAREIRYPEELNLCDGLIMPGGESTTMSKLLEQNSLSQPLMEWKKPIFATCAGMILLSKWGVLKVALKRNAYGRQSESFTAELAVNFPKRTSICTGVFIRAPKIVAVLSHDVEVLSSNNCEPVFVRQGNILASTFHPELTEEREIHTFFIEVCDEFSRQNSGVLSS